MLNRVTNLTTTATAQRALQANQSKLADVQEQAMTLNRLKRPSDDPAATSQALQTRALQAAAAQYGRNIDDGGGWLTTADAALGQATNVLNKIRDLTVQAGNGTMNQTAKDAIASEFEALNKDLLSLANTKYQGRSIFAGTSDASVAFSDSMPPQFNGTPGSSVQRRISETETVRVDADGTKLFGDGAESIFAVVAGMAANLKAGNDVTAQLDAVNARLNTVIAGRAEIGVQQSRLERAGTVNLELESSLDAQRTGIEKLDLGSVILDLKLQENNYQVALAATARVLQPTLMDFLR